MLPQGPLDKIFERIGSATLSPSQYVKELARHLKRVHDGVSGYVSADYERKRFKADLGAPDSWLPQVGDIVLLRKPPAAALRSHGGAGGQ